jgi:PKD repeat protein
MKPIRTAVPAQPTKMARHAATRVAQAVALFAAVLVGAVSCSEVTTQPLAPMEVVFDSAGPMEGKLNTLQADDPIQPAASTSPSELRPLASSSSAGGVAAYTVSSIAHAPEVGPFSKTYPRCDDCAFAVDLGFNFNFFGVDYSRLWISSNGHVTFQPSVFPHGYYGGYARGYPIPNPDAASDNPVNNVIGLAWSDLSTLNGGAISHLVRGEPGKRRLIVNFAAVPVVLEESRKVTVQLILREGTNEIEIHTASKPVTSHFFTQGIENKDGTEAYFVPGRVAARWSLTNDAVRFAPAVQNRAPVANAGGNAGRYEGVEGTAIQFVGSGSDADNDALTFSWDFNGDGVADASSAAASHTYADNGAHSAVLTVSDGRGGVAQARVDVVVANAKPVVNAGADVRVNAGESVGFSGQFSDKGVKDAPWRWVWDLGSHGSYDGNAESQAAAIVGSKRFCKAGSFPVKLTVVDKDGGSGSDELVVTVDALPVQIDVDPNAINLNGNGHGMVTVRIYSRDGLDATALNPDAIRLTNGSGQGTQLARSGSGRWHWSADADLNGDGRLDVSAGFRRDELIANGDLTPGTAELSLSGEVGSCGDALGKAPVRVMGPGRSAR